jgi:DNA repair exonuclease SbcCD ATPase subunit
MYKLSAISLIIFFPLQINVFAACTAVVEGDSEETIIQKNRNCRNHFSNIKNATSDLSDEEKEKEIERVKGILKSNNRSFHSDADRTISKNSKSIKKNLKSIKESKELIDENIKLIGKNVETIKKNEKLLHAVDDDLYLLEKGFDNFTNYQDKVNDLNAKAIGQNLEDVAEIFKNLAKKQKEITFNQIDIEKNKALIAENFSKSMELFEKESKDREEQLKNLENSLRQEIESKLGNVCSSLKYCGAANADVSSAKRGASLNYNRSANVDSSNRSSKPIIDSLGISNFGERSNSNLSQ